MTTEPAAPPLLDLTPKPAQIDLINYSILLVGPPGIGKSTFIASAYPAEQGFYLDTDTSESLIAYSLPKLRITTWQDYADTIRAAGDDERIKWVFIDTLNGTYDLCSRQICGEKNITSPADLNDYGATWSQISERFMKPLKFLEAKGKGLICTAHATITDVWIGGRNYNRWIPSFPGSSINSAYAQVEKFFKVIGFMQKESVVAPAVRIVRSKKGGDKEIPDIRKDTSEMIQERVIHFEVGENWVAKDRSGRLPSTLQLPTDWQQDWTVFKSYFTNNNQTSQEN